MIVVISPAKTLDYSRPHAPVPSTPPRFQAEASDLARSAARLSPKRLGELMRISDKLAELNADRFRSFDQAPERPAIYAFAGDVYVGFEARSLEPEAIAFAQDHLRILSGLYGLLRPLDAIRPYRLEMGTRWAPGRAKTLVEHWGARVAEALRADLQAEGSGVLLNLASREYWAAVDGRLPPDIRVVSVDFREPGPDGPRFLSFAAKKARGMMARWMCEHHVTDIEAMKGFDSDGYRFDPEGSSPDRWRFSRA